MTEIRAAALHAIEHASDEGQALHGLALAVLYVGDQLARLNDAVDELAPSHSAGIVDRARELRVQTVPNVRARC